jgi:hypothetical protein
MSLKDFEIYTTVDTEALKETLAKQRSQRLIENLEASRKEEALMWLLENNIGPTVEGLEFYRGGNLSWTCGYEFQIPLYSLEDIDLWLGRLTDAGWETAEPEDKQTKDRVNRGYGSKGNYLVYKFRPGDELMKQISDKFDFEFAYVKEKDYHGNERPREFNFSRWMIDLHLEFYPTEESECKITLLGTTKVEREQSVWEVTCAEGAAEMEALLNGGVDA